MDFDHAAGRGDLSKNSGRGGYRGKDEIHYYEDRIKERYHGDMGGGMLFCLLYSAVRDQGAGLVRRTETV